MSGGVCPECDILAQPGVAITLDLVVATRLRAKRWAWLPDLFHLHELDSIQYGAIVMDAHEAGRALPHLQSDVQVRQHDPAPFQPSADGVPWCCQEPSRRRVRCHFHERMDAELRWWPHVSSTPRCCQLPASVCKSDAHIYQHVLEAARARYAGSSLVARLTVAT